MKELLAACRAFYLAYLSKPAKDRVLYRALRRAPVKRILEIGMEPGRRSGRLIEFARKTWPAETLCYTGIDLFELSPAGRREGMSLKSAHCKLQASGARVRLVPGDALSALSAAANQLGQCDLIVISAPQDAQALEKAWFYVPRLLHPATRVFVETSDGGSAGTRFELIDHDEIRRRANASHRRTAA
jgi:hypothetical protein